MEVNVISYCALVSVPHQPVTDDYLASNSELYAVRPALCSMLSRPQIRHSAISISRLNGASFFMGAPCMTSHRFPDIIGRMPEVPAHFPRMHWVDNPSANSSKC